MKSLFRTYAINALLVSINAVFLSACSVSLKSDRISWDAVSAAQITQLEHQFAEAALRGDSAGIEALLAPEFVGIDPGGRELSRSQVLEQLKSPERRIEMLRHDNIRVRVFGDCAIVFAVTVMKGTHQGAAFQGEFPYMRVWIKRQGRWLAAATQSSSGSH